MPLRSLFSPPHLLARGRLTASRIVLAMVSVIALLGVLAYMDQTHETQAALADFAAEQVMIAHAATSALGLSVTGASGSAPASETFREIATRLRTLEQPTRIRVLVAPPGSAALFTLDGQEVHSAPLEQLLAQPSAESWVRLNHAQAEEIGLTPRTAVAGMSELPSASGVTGAPWHLFVVASARHESDRQERGLRRTALGFLFASATVIVFGALALRIQRKEIDLAQELAFTEKLREKDEKLVRADKLATLGAMATGIAHQVATPLAVIVARADRLARRVTEDDKAAHAVQVISEQADRIHVIIRSFLQIARGGSPALEHVEPRALVETTMDLVAHRFTDAGVQLTSAFDDPCPTIACDPRLFEQALVNLLLNACDACSRGGAVTVSARARDDARSVCFAVEDDGIGITEQVRARAAEPFFTTKNEGAGTGLGLAIASEIVHHHGGELHLEPRAGGGTRATLDVPAVVVAQERAS